MPPGLQELSGRIALSETKPKHRRDTAPATETLSRRTASLVNVTMLGFLLADPDLVHDPDTHYRMLEANVREGASDGIYGRPIMKEDGISSLNGHYPAA